MVYRRTKYAVFEEFELAIDLSEELRVGSTEFGCRQELRYEQALTSASLGVLSVSMLRPLLAGG